MTDINKPWTPDKGENKQQQTIQQIKKLLSKKNTAPKLDIIQWPMWCMLWIALFDQSPEAQSISWLWFTVWAEFLETKIGLHYCVQLYKPTVSIEDKDIVVSGKIIKVPEDRWSELEKEKFTFLPEGTEVRVKYNQDEGKGELEIMAYPLDLHESTKNTSDASIENFKGQTNIVSTLIGELNDNFERLEKLQSEISKEWTDKQIWTTREKLIQSINFLRTIQSETFKENAYQTIKDSQEYNQVKEYKEEVKRKSQEKEDIQKGFDDLQKVNVEKLRKYNKQQDAHLSNIQEILESETSEEEEKIKNLKIVLSKACSIWLFCIADNFIAQDNTSHTYRNVPYEKEPEYAKWKLNIEEVRKTIGLLIEIQSRYPEILKQLGVADQIKDSIHEWKMKVEENVRNKIYNPCTRGSAIRYDELWTMLGKVCGDDLSVLKDMVAIFDLLMEQRHPDGTNSGSFQYAVQEGISLYMEESKSHREKNKEVLAIDVLNNMNMLEYFGKEFSEQVWIRDIDSPFWMEVFISWAIHPAIEKKYLKLLAQESSKIRSSSFSTANIQEYIKFLTTYFQTKKYEIQKTWSVDKEAIIKEVHEIYQQSLDNKEAEKQRKEKTIACAKEKVQEIFTHLTPEQKKEYFTKVYDQTRWQTHRTWIHTYQEFDNGGISTVISEHSYYGSRWGIERDSQLCIYVNGCKLKSSTWYNNYRDRYDAKNDNYNNQYVEVQEVTKEGEKYIIKVKTWSWSTRILTMSPESIYQIDMKIMTGISWLSQKDTTLLMDAIKFQKELDKKN